MFFSANITIGSKTEVRPSIVYCYAMSLTTLLAEHLVRDLSRFVTEYAFEDLAESNYYEERWDLLTDPCIYAATNGYLDLLRWARANYHVWNIWTCAYAARYGNLDVLQWARASGCPWDARTCAASAYGGHLAILQWARANGCPWNATTCANLAIELGHLDLLRWARANGALSD
jgi:hypothetical protein